LYQPVCKDVFGGGRDKSVEGIKSYKVEKNLENFWISSINLGGDYSWMFLALAKYYEGDTELGEQIKANWREITARRGKFTEVGETISSQFTSHYVFLTSLHSLSYCFLQNAIDNLDKDSPFHPYGFTQFMAFGLGDTYDIEGMVSREADSFDSAKEFMPEMFSIINQATLGTYLGAMALRLKVATKLDAFDTTVTYHRMLKNNNNLKDFRTTLYAMCSIDMLKDRQDQGVDRLIRSILSDPNVEIVGIDNGPGRRRSRPNLPPDIGKMRLDD
jgi:hypothetical protein